MYVCFSGKVRTINLQTFFPLPVYQILIIVDFFYYISTTNQKIMQPLRGFQLFLGVNTYENWRPFYLPPKYYFRFISLVGYTLFQDFYIQKFGRYRTCEDRLFIVYYPIPDNFTHWASLNRFNQAIIKGLFDIYTHHSKHICCRTCIKDWFKKRWIKSIEE